MRTFTFYEFTGFLVPGALAITGIAFIYPSTREALFIKDVSLGDLGLFVVISYASGHFIQALGNAMEWLWWRALGGMPTDWIRTGKKSVLSPVQMNLLMCRLAKLLEADKFNVAEMSADDWHAVTRQVHAVVVMQAKIEQLETFNGNYGLNRGIAAALIVIAAAILMRDAAGWRAALAAVAGAVVALLRMHRFAKRYARELFVQFLSRATDAQCK